MASIKDAERVADDLEQLVSELRSEIQDGPDFEKLVQIADEISEHADNAAQTFTNINEVLMSRIGELSGGNGKKSQRSGSQSRAKSESSSSD